MENDNDTLTKKILNGWKSLIMGSSSPQRKPFPKNQFFSPEQLSFLSKQENNTLLEKWAVELGKETAKKSNASAEFNPVQWSDGLLGSWIDGNPYYIDKQTQANYLRMLGDNGYQLTPEHENFIKQQEKVSLIGKVLEDKDSYFLIEDGNFSKEFENSFNLHSFSKKDMADATVPFDLDMFHEEMRNGGMRFLAEYEKDGFNRKYQEWKDARKLFYDTLKTIGTNQSHRNGGVFPPELMFGQGNSSLGQYELSSWKSNDNHTISVNVKLGHSKETSTIVISEENAYRYSDLVQDVSNLLAMGQASSKDEGNKLAENVHVSNQFVGENKLLPRSRYFTSEDLEVLSKVDHPTLLEKWAVELGSHCSKVSSSLPAKTFAPVLWHEGKLSSWVDGDVWELGQKRNEQNLSQLRQKGYELSDASTTEHLRLLGNQLSKKLYVDFDNYIKVDGIADDGKLRYTQFGQNTMEPTKKEVEWLKFIDKVGNRSFRDVSNEFYQNDFTQKMQKVMDSQQVWRQTINRIKSLEVVGGNFSIEEGKHEYTSLGDYVGESWKLQGDDSIEYKGYFGDDRNNIESRAIDQNSAYHYKDLLSDINANIDGKLYPYRPYNRHSVQGLEAYDKQELRNLVEDFFTESFEGVENPPEIKGMEVYGSRGRGTAKEGSDLDVVIQYEGDWKEDSVFNVLHENPLEIEGIKVDINPITKGQTGSLAKFMVRSREYDKQVLLGNKPRFSLATSNSLEQLDHEYMEAVKTGDLEKAQQMVNDAAKRSGYIEDSSYQGKNTSMTGAAPWGNGYFLSPEERKAAWDADPEHSEFEGAYTLSDYIKNGIDKNLSELTNPASYRSADDTRKEAIANLRGVIDSKSEFITMYRSVPSNIKEEGFRNGDWITPSRSYAVKNAHIQGFGDNYRIIEQKVPISEVWNDGFDIAEWGYGREEDYVNDKDFAYKNTANNKKSLEAVTYDDEGKVIPLSKRFNENVKDIRFQTISNEHPLTKEEEELRDTLVDKLRSSGIEVITDEREGQRVLELFKDSARTMSFGDTRMGNDKEASRYLSSIGLTGIKYPAGTIMGGAEKGDMEIQNLVRFFKSEKGEAYGYTVNDKIYIDPHIASAETPIHEYTHLWATAMQNGNPRQWQNFVSLMKDTPVWNEVREKYTDLTTDDEIADEVLATYSGRRGAEKLRQMANEAKDGRHSAAMKSNIARGIFMVQQALEKFWKGVSSFLGIHFGSAEEVADRVMKDMLDGINPSKHLREFNEARNKEYAEAVESGDLGKAYDMVVEEASRMLAENPMPEVTDAYEVEKEKMPEKTIHVYKVFTVDKDGDPSALFVSGKDKIPLGVWLKAQDTWHFTAENGKQYVPSTKNPSTQGGKTGASIKIPSDEVRQELIQRGYLPEGSKAKYITALAYRPGWHAADLPYFPQGGKQDVESNYGNVHRYNQVVYDCELAADIDYTPLARNQKKAFKADGTLNVRDADLQWMPQKGFYQYTTNQFLPDSEKGHWYIGGAMRINRALSQEECDKILQENGKQVQEWEQGHLDLEKLGIATRSSHLTPILSPVAFHEDGSLVPLSERFTHFKEEVNPESMTEGKKKVRFLFVGEKGAKNMDDTYVKKYALYDYSHIRQLSQAKTMQKNGHDAKEIKQSTGWEVGTDGMWRHESCDIKRFDWDGNLCYEKNHPDYRRYLDLVEKENRHLWMDDEPLTNEEQKERAALSLKYPTIPEKLDNNYRLEAYVDAPELFTAYPDMRNMGISFQELDNSIHAKYQRSIDLLDSILDVEDKIGDETIIINKNVFNKMQAGHALEKAISHELQHAIQIREGFAKGGHYSTLREDMKKELTNNAGQLDYIKSHLKMWASYEQAAKKLEKMQLYGSNTELGKQRRTSWYWDAMNIVDSDDKIRLVNEYDKVYGKDWSKSQPVEDGYHVNEAIRELRRVAQEHKQSLTAKDLITLDNMNKIETALDEDSDYDMYWKLAGEVEARNVEKRFDMTMNEKTNSLASDTEDVARKEQLVIISPPASSDLNLVPKEEGRWHNKENQERDTYALYGKMLAQYLVDYSNEQFIPWNRKSNEPIDGNGKKYQGVAAYMLGVERAYVGYTYPIFLTNEQIEKEGYQVKSTAKPFPVIIDGKVEEVYNVAGLTKNKTPLVDTPEIYMEYESWQRMNTPMLKSMDVFPAEDLPELGLEGRETFSDKSLYHMSLAEVLVDKARGEMPSSPSAKSMESLIKALSNAMLGQRYNFNESAMIPNGLQLAARLERDPDFAKKVLQEAALTSGKVEMFIEESVRSWGDEKKIDLRSLSSSDLDLDGNGVIDNQENYVADVKQGNEDGKEEHKEQHTKMRMRA